MRFTHTIAAVTAVEEAHIKGQWRIGDAIAADLRAAGYVFNPAAGLKEIPKSVWQECSEQIGKVQARERDYAPLYCGVLCRTAVTFPRDERNPKYSWDAHAEAGTPNNLREAASALRKLKVPRSVTIYNVRWIMQEWRDKADVERRKANAQARADREKAKEERRKAAEAALKAKDKAAKDAAKKARDAAKQEEQAAKQRVLDTASPPKRNEDVQTSLQEPGTLDVMSIHLGITIRAKQIEKLARETLKEIVRIQDAMTPAMIKEIVTGTARIITVCQEINETINANKLHRFKVHEGGAA